jgi:hypothetical protein
MLPSLPFLSSSFRFFLLGGAFHNLHLSVHPLHNSEFPHPQALTMTQYCYIIYLCNLFTASLQNTAWLLLGAQLIDSRLSKSRSTLVLFPYCQLPLYHLGQSGWRTCCCRVVLIGNSGALRKGNLCLGTAGQNPQSDLHVSSMFLNIGYEQSQPHLDQVMPGLSAGWDL